MRYVLYIAVALVVAVLLRERIVLAFGVLFLPRKWMRQALLRAIDKGAQQPRIYERRP